MQHEFENELPRIPHVSNISYQEFVAKFLTKNVPCLLEEIHTRSWRSRQEWILNGKPHFEFLRENFGKQTAACNYLIYATLHFNYFCAVHYLT